MRSIFYFGTRRERVHGGGGMTPSKKTEKPKVEKSLEAPLLSSNGEEKGKVQLPAHVFGQKPSSHFLHEVITAYLANQRRGTASTKTRSDVSGGGHKPWKQKHTGRARAGSNRSPLWRKGGVVFGPHPRSYRQELPEGKRQIGLAQALSAKWLRGEISVLQSLQLEEPKTKKLAQIFQQLGSPAKSLLVVEQVPEPLRRAARNLSQVRLTQASDVGAYEVLSGGQIFLTESAVKKVAERLKPRGI
ncbi:MAG: 50S ribosomal protein L4 [Elusimicrobia bacterium]|nr:50S ribosomal protein L4 [Elusimicrobiota bacterium]